MVQKEVKKKTKTYGTAGVLLAVLMVSMIYVFGIGPITMPPTNNPVPVVMPAGQNNPLLLGMKSFSSVDELRNFLTTNTEGRSTFGGGPLDAKFFGISSMPTPMPASVPQTMGEAGFYGMSTSPVQDYSTTNIQVAGVDEADIVKTDGQYIYTISMQSNNRLYYYGGNYPEAKNAVYIIKADPQSPQIISKITLENNSQPAGLFLSQDGNKLVVLASRYQYYAMSDSGREIAMLGPYHSDVYTFINVYDLTNKATPVLTRNLTVSGSYFNSRMIGNYVYAVISQPAYVANDVVTLPVVYAESKASQIAPQQIYYSDMVAPTYYTYTSFFGINILDDTQQPTNMTVMMGGASTMYVSTSNIYVTYPSWSEQGQITTIYRVRINGADLFFEAKGSVPGYVLNQYSMDEYSGNFRIAVNWHSEVQMNNVYVLNSNLTVIGRLEGLAQNENLHSVRFMGDKVYLVTFKKTDPLFVIDLSQPENPRVLGELKIPGYSDYLHPYDETHLIGFGKETVEAEQGDFAWYQGLKLSLFDVSNVNNPVQLAKYVIGDRGTDSIALTEPKAFLFDKQKNLLVIPVNLAEIDETIVNPSASAHGEMVWQGAYVFSLTLNGGFTYKGRITHLTDEILSNQPNTSPSKPSRMPIDTSIWSSQDYWINRALYIGDTLYTISNSQVKLNSLTNLSQIAVINLN